MARPRMRPSDAFLALWPAAVLIGLGVAGFLGLLDWVVEQEDLFRLDEPLVEWLAAHRTPTLTTILTVVTTVFGPVVLPIIVAAIALVWWRVTKSWWHPMLLVGAMVLSTTLTVVLKAVVGRARPGEDFMSVPGFETSGSFPSGHTIGASTLVLVLGYLLWHEDADASWRLTAWAVLSFAIIGIVAVSRMYLGYHFLTDVLAGACVGVAVLGVVVGIERWRDLSLERRDPPERLLTFAEADAQEAAVMGQEGGDAPGGDDASAEPLPWAAQNVDSSDGDERPSSE
ncbi:phosphatase PAP2 family protein [Demequina sp.]|uniref:phosphatase PAP2 family protein n=1 Tax=Demequina sp. TaxID=2050685 RepID=UPI0025FD7B8C|nr:phosphatase PAP2 family protein [Demequina sp.]